METNLNECQPHNSYIGSKKPPNANPHLRASQFLHRLKETAKRQSPPAASNLHVQLIKNGLINAQLLANSLLDSYGKCGTLQEARYLFDEMPRRDHFSWATILTAYSIAGFPSKALLVFPAMHFVDGCVLTILCVPASLKSALAFALREFPCFPRIRQHTIAYVLTRLK